MGLLWISFVLLAQTTPRILPDLATENLDYDVWGRLWHRRDFAGKTTTYGYDALDRLKTKTADSSHPSLAYAHAIARVEYDYDANGAREAARTYNAANTLLYTESTPRDERGHLDYKDTPEGRLDYDYYTNGQLKDTVSSNPDGVNLGYRYDDANRLAYVDDATNGVPARTTGYTYNPNGSLETVAYANGVTHTYGYDALNRLRTLNVAQTAGLGAVLHAYEYKLTVSGHRHQVIEGSKTTTYDYDDLYRLTGETITGASSAQNGTVGYGLDKVGNRLNRTSSIAEITAQLGRTYNSRDQLAGDVYDLNGNTQTGVLSGTGILPVGSSVTVPDVYDFEDRLIVRTKPDDSTINLSYDADGLRTQKTILNSGAQLVSTTHYLLDTNNLTGYAQVVEESTADASGTTLKTYTYGSDLISRSVSLNAQPSTLNYYIYDGGGSVRELTDETGSITDRYTYDAFGVLIAQVGMSDNAYLYRGEQWDADLGLYYLRARFMNPDSGRFWNQDSYEGENTDPISLHKYTYANANPVRYSDPTGLLGDLSLPGLSMTQAAQFIVGSIAIVSITRYAQNISLGGEVIDGNPIGRALAGLSTAVAGELIYSNYESVREQLKKAASVVATAALLSVRPPKFVPVSLSITPNIAINVAIYQGGVPQLLTRVNRAQAIRNRAAAIGSRGPAGPGLSWDEYPFASTMQGGAGASVIAVPQMENWMQGGIIGAAYAIEQINVGDDFWAVVVP